MADVAAETGATMAGGKRSAWLAHVMKMKRAHKGKSLKQVMKMASKTFKKTRKGGAAALSPAAVGGRRRRSTKRGTRKH